MSCPAARTYREEKARPWLGDIAGALTRRRSAALFTRVALNLLSSTMIACHADHIGSLLRPSELIAAREDAAAGRISRARFKAMEDRAVQDAIKLQEGVGLPVVTDGEQRRLL